MALPAHHSLPKTRLPDGGTRYTITDPRLPGVVGEVEHGLTAPHAPVRHRVLGADGMDTRWFGAPSVSTAVTRVHTVLSTLISRANRDQQRDRLRRRFPRACSRCGSGVGEPCRTVSGRATDTHAARR